MQFPIQASNVPTSLAIFCELRSRRPSTAASHAMQKPPHSFIIDNSGHKTVKSLCSPDILTHALDPVTQLVNTGIPVLQPVPHPINLLHIQNLGLHPIDLRHARNLIDRAPQQTQRQGLHNQVLNLIRLHLRLGGDGGECEGAVVRWTTEDHLCQRGQRDLLVQEDPVGLEQLVLADIPGQHVVGCQVAAVEGEEEVAEPVVGGFGERVQDRVQEKFAEIVDRVGD